MTTEPTWIDKRALLLLHQESLDQFGGAGGMRDEGLLDSALARPQNTYFYNPESTLEELAASYAFGIVKNHGFVDGNKRAAFLSIGLFLAINGRLLAADPSAATAAIVNTASGEMREAALAAWIRQYSAATAPTASHG